MEKLFDTAAAVFLEHGFENANVSEIAARAGASKGTIYSRYPTKADLFAAVLTRQTLELQVYDAEILTSHKPLKQVLESYGVRLLQRVFNSEWTALYKVFIAKSPMFPKLTSNFWEVGPRQSMAMLRDYLAKHPEFKGKDPGHAAEMFWSLCCGQAVLKALLQKEHAMSEAAIRAKVKEAIRIFLSAYSKASNMR
jgi:AcrR family transcriptional regulator